MPSAFSEYARKVACLPVSNSQNCLRCRGCGNKNVSGQTFRRVSGTVVALGVGWGGGWHHTKFGSPLSRGVGEQARHCLCTNQCPVTRFQASRKTNTTRFGPYGLGSLTLILATEPAILFIDCRRVVGFGGTSDYLRRLFGPVRCHRPIRGQEKKRQ